jgi:dihydrofolate reductase
MEIILIAAMAANRVIGRNNTIPWHIQGEQKRFKEVTWGHPLIMGRKTHESIGRPLPGRRNIVVTRNRNYASPGCEIVYSLDEAYTLCRGEKQVFNIGGEQLYLQGLNRADTLLLTVLRDMVAGDAYFPEFSSEIFVKISEEYVDTTPPYSIQTFQRV